MFMSSVVNELDNDYARSSMSGERSSYKMESTISRIPTDDIGSKLGLAGMLSGYEVSWQVSGVFRMIVGTNCDSIA